MKELEDEPGSSVKVDGQYYIVSDEEIPEGPDDDGFEDLPPNSSSGDDLRAGNLRRRFSTF